MKPKLVVALTGGIGSGKTTVADMFAELGVTLIDSDVLAREVVEPGQPALEEVVSAFGSDVLDETGKLNRAALREIVFGDAEKRRTLEAILHPRIIAEMNRRIEQVEGSYCLVCIPLLFETGRQTQFDRTLVVDLPPELQIERTLKRDGSPRATIEGILAAQVARSRRLELADDVIDNSGEIRLVRREVDKLHQKYLELAEH